MYRHLLLLFLISIAFKGSSIYAESWTIVHVNDVHGRCINPDGGSTLTQTGGLARLSTLINQARLQNPDRFLFLDAGDVTSKSDPLVTLSGGHLYIDWLNLMHVDAFVPGNGEFYWGIGSLRRLQHWAKFPFLFANLKTPLGEPILDSMMIKELDGVKFGIFGVGFIRMEHPLAFSFNLMDPLEAARKCVSELRQKADVVIMLSHCGVDVDQEIASKVSGIDLIVGAHTHTELHETLWVDTPKGRTAIVQTGDYGRYLGHVDLEIMQNEDTWKLESITSKLIPVDASVPLDAQTLDLINQAIETYNPQDFKYPIDTSGFCVVSEKDALTHP